MISSEQIQSKQILDTLIDTYSTKHCALLDEYGIYRSSTEHGHNAHWAYGVRTDINDILYYSKEEPTYVRPILSLA